MRTLCVMVAVLLTAPLPVSSQEATIPRVRTFPGIPPAAFPYAKPEEVGLSSEKLNHRHRAGSSAVASQFRMRFVIRGFVEGSWTGTGSCRRNLPRV